jgi:hypothetical protein
MERNIDQNLVRVSSKIEIDKQIELGEDVEFTMKANCVKIETFDNQDGTVNRLYVLKPLEIKLWK